jgi:hypothetical protein
LRRARGDRQAAGSRRPEILRTIADPGQLPMPSPPGRGAAQPVLAAVDRQRVDRSAWAKGHLAELQVTAQITPT